MAKPKFKLPDDSAFDPRPVKDSQESAKEEKAENVGQKKGQENKTQKRKPVADEPEKAKPEDDVQEEDELLQETKKTRTAKTGRPKGAESTKISLNVPNETLELVEIAAGLNYKGNVSGYINDLIRQDIKANGEVYEQVKELRK